jgi:phosphoglycolate phosphatase-like HAD superfamily hydrolase
MSSQSSAVVFDLDGTLIDTDHFDAELYAAAVRDIVGDVEIDRSWRRYRHVTDAGVLAEIVEELGLSNGEHVVSRVRDRFGSLVRTYLDGDNPCLEIPGAKAALEALERSGCRVGIATGGWGHTARMKLDRAGFAAHGVPLVSSDESPDRVEIMMTCLERLGGASDRAVYVGDGLWDLAASRRAGWRFIGVGEKLRGRCESWVADFTDPMWRLLRPSQ